MTARKATSAKVARAAGSLLSRISRAQREINAITKAEEALTVRKVKALADWGLILDEMESVAGSALSQREPKSKNSK